MKSDRKFKQSTLKWEISDEWSEILENYILHGLSPGGFFTSILANDMHRAMINSHPANSLKNIKSVCRWIVNEGPNEAYGSYKVVEAWCKMLPDERRKICEDLGIMMSMWDVLKE